VPDHSNTLCLTQAYTCLVDLRWIVSLGLILHYEFTITDGATVTTVTTHDAGTSYEFNGLLAETEYNISVAAVNVAGAGPAMTVSTTTGRA